MWREVPESTIAHMYSRPGVFENLAEKEYRVEILPIRGTDVSCGVNSAGQHKISGSLPCLQCLAYELSVGT
eukprot:40517-Rhodomonas_salina.1